MLQERSWAAHVQDAFTYAITCAPQGDHPHGDFGGAVPMKPSTYAICALSPKGVIMVRAPQQPCQVPLLHFNNPAVAVSPVSVSAACSRTIDRKVYPSVASLFAHALKLRILVWPRRRRALRWAPA